MSIVDSMPVRRSRKGIPANRFPEVTTETLASLYATGLSLASIGEMFGMTLSAVVFRLERAGIDRRRGAAKTNRNTNWWRKHTYDEHYFDEIDTEEKAYWMGFLLADGCVRNGSHSITINLQEDDAGHLNKFRAALQATSLVSLHKQGSFPRPAASITITSRVMAPVLHSHGLVAGAKFPFPVAKHLERHYWRGAVDGDGTVGMYAHARKTIRARQQMRLELVGTEETIAAFRAFAVKVSGTKAACRKTGRKLWRFSLNGPKALLVAKELYAGASVYLERKMAKFVEFAPQCEPVPRRCRKSAPMEKAA